MFVTREYFYSSLVEENSLQQGDYDRYTSNWMLMSLLILNSLKSFCFSYVSSQDLQQGNVRAEKEGVGLMDGLSPEPGCSEHGLLSTTPVLKQKLKKEMERRRRPDGMGKAIFLNFSP